ncbi:Equilibrative nucleoside transporter 4 [Nymphon striatum]|nr:Equilibrative nucleoside transporter 4 [Nymphon striatum]
MDEGLSLAYVQLGKAHWSVEGPGPETVFRRKSLKSHHMNVPRDPCNCIYFALVLAGAGFLLPYNSFIIAVDYFQARYPGTTIVFDMSLVYILMAFFAVTINNFLIESLSLHIRISFGYILAFFTLLFVAFFEIWFEAFEDSIAYNINLIAVAVVACGCTVQQSSFYGYTSMLPARYTQAVMTGEKQGQVDAIKDGFYLMKNFRSVIGCVDGTHVWIISPHLNEADFVNRKGAAGLITSINRILTKMLLDDERINTIIFFGISIISLLLCFVIHFVVQRTEFVKFYIESCNSAKEDEDRRHITLEPCEVDILEAADSKRGSYGVLSLQSSSSLPTDSAFQSVENVSATSSAVQGADIYVETYRVGTGEERQRVITKPMYKVQDELKKIRRGVLARWDVAKLVWPYMLSIGLAYFVTLCLFPGIESEVTSCNLHSWMPVILMAIFNLFDFIGKILTCIPYDWTRKKLVLWSVARVLLIPLLVMCATPRVNSLIPGEGWPMFFSLALGLSNGILGSVPMIMAPSRVPNEHKEITGNIMMLSYSIGLTAGSGVSYILDAILGPHVTNICGETVITTITDSLFNSTMLATNLTNLSR